MMRQRALEMALSKLGQVKNPVPHLEQYRTPSDIAVMTLFQAHATGDIEDRRMVDLGCGNGILSIGSALLGASFVLAVDIAANSIDAARANLAATGTDGIVHLVQGNVAQGPALGFVRWKGEPLFDTCIMNPPFGCQNKGADIPFLSSAMDLARVVYSFHMASTQDYISAFVNERGGQITHSFLVKMELPWMFSFHRMKKSIVDVGLFRITSR